MRQIALIYNPMSGRQHQRRAAQIEAALAVLRDAGIQAGAVRTSGPGTAGAQAAEAVRQGCDAVFACGGDGTAHEVLQGMIGSKACLGIIPLGTANALAVDLGLPSASAKAARVLLDSEPVRIAAGRLSYCRRDGSTSSRYFTVAAGIGPDALLWYQLDAQLKHRFGYFGYVAEAWRIWATHEFPLFEVEVWPADSSQRRVEQVSQLLAVRISDFGGIIRHLAPGAALRHNHLRLVLFKTRNRARYLQYLAATLLGFEPRLRHIELLDATAVECRLPLTSQSRIHVQADGELLGTLPVRIDIVPDAVTLLMPRKNRSSAVSR